MTVQEIRSGTDSLGRKYFMVIADGIYRRVSEKKYREAREQMFPCDVCPHFKKRKSFEF